jgi:predicted phage baseplate assembly protein
MQIYVPPVRRCRVNGRDLYWVRVRHRKIRDAEARLGIRQYEKSPRLHRVSVMSWGGTVGAAHAQQITRELLGQSDGSPGQRFQLQRVPLLERGPGETLIVQHAGGLAEPWTEVSDFAGSEANDRHFTLDGVTGELRLGPALRQPDGTVKLFGAIPQRGWNLVFERYRYGGGQEGNVQAGVLNTLKTAIPYIARVNNRHPAWGGLDAESLESAMMRAPALLRSRDRAVTEEDFEFLARQALPATIGRVKCLQPLPSEAGRVAPGQVYVLAIPRVPDPGGFLARDRLKLEDEDITSLRAYLDERRLLTTRLDIREPGYHGAAVNVKLRPIPGTDPARVEADVLARLYHFLNPLTGGPEGTGWPFGRDLFASDVYQCLQGLPGVQFVRGLELCAAEPGGQARGDPVECIEVLTHGVIVSGRHKVEFV